MSQPGRCSCSPSRNRPRRVSVPGTQPDRTSSKRDGRTCALSPRSFAAFDRARSSPGGARDRSWRSIRRARSTTRPSAEDLSSKTVATTSPDPQNRLPWSGSGSSRFAGSELLNGPAFFRLRPSRSVAGRFALIRGRGRVVAQQRADPPHPLQQLALFLRRQRHQPLVARRDPAPPAPSRSARSAGRPGPPWRAPPPIRRSAPRSRGGRCPSASGSAAAASSSPLPRQPAGAHPPEPGPPSPSAAFAVPQETPASRAARPEAPPARPASAPPGGGPGSVRRD